MHKITRLSNGIRLIYEYIPYVKSVSVGVFTAAGSRYETPEFHGISHFIEHMLFKGTASRSAKDIAVEIDAVGGTLNAFTAREATCFYTKTLDSDLELSFDLLSDMFFCSEFDDAYINTEKSVVKEEIDMCEDSPEELVHDILNEICYPDHPIGYNILGTKKSVDSLDSALIRKYMSQRYCADSIVISVAGSFDENQLFSLADRYFNREIKQISENLIIEKPKFVFDNKTRKKQVEQANVAIALPGVCYYDKNMYAINLIGNLLGGGMSSRLFQHIREEKGLAYSVYSCPNVYTETGYTSIYAGCSFQNLDTVCELIQAELSDLYKNGISSDEAEFSRNQMKGSCVLALESPGSIMSENGKQLLLYNEVKTAQEFLDIIDKISDNDIKNALEFFNPSKFSTAVVTNFG